MGVAFSKSKHRRQDHLAKVLPGLSPPLPAGESEWSGVGVTAPSPRSRGMQERNLYRVPAD